MHRILLWRAGLECWNLVAWLLQFKLFVGLRRFDREVGYFAFGANLDPSVLTRRRMRVRAERELLLRDHELRFNQPGTFQGFGFASAEAASGKFVYGKVLTIGAVDARRMDYYEAMPFLKRHRRVSATQNGAHFFFYQATHPRAGLMPTEEYLNKILYSASRSQIIPPAYLAELQATPTLTELTPAADINFLIADYDVWPRSLSGARREYDRKGIKLLIALMNAKLSARWIRPQLPVDLTHPDSPQNPHGEPQLAHDPTGAD